MKNEPSLYPDLQELVLEFLVADVPAFLNCRLACKDWENFCRQRVFRSVDLTSSLDDKQKNHFLGFACLLNAPSPPAFAPYIQHITLDGHPSPEDIRALRTERLANVYSLRIKSECSLSPGYFRAVSQQFSRITHLDIIDIPFMMRRTLLDFICSFKELQRLALGDPRWLGFWMDAHHGIERGRWTLPSITSLSLSLELGEVLEQTFLGWLLEQLHSRNTLRTLEYRASVVHPDTNKALLASVSPYVEILLFDSEFARTLNILKSPERRFPCLTTLRLGVAIIEVRVSTVGALPSAGFPAANCFRSAPRASLEPECLATMIEALYKLEAPELQDLSFKFYPRPEAGDFDQHVCSMNILQYIRFTKLDELLSQSSPPFPSLHAVSLISAQVPPPACQEYLVLPEEDEIPRYMVPDAAVEVSSEEYALSFFKSAFPLTFSHGSVTLQAVAAP